MFQSFHGNTNLFSRRRCFPGAPVITCYCGLPPASVTMEKRTQHLFAPQTTTLMNFTACANATAMPSAQPITSGTIKSAVVSAKLKWAAQATTNGMSPSVSVSAIAFVPMGRFWITTRARAFVSSLASHANCRIHRTAIAKLTLRLWRQWRRQTLRSCRDETTRNQRSTIATSINALTKVDWTIVTIVTQTVSLLGIAIAFSFNSTVFPHFI